MEPCKGLATGIGSVPYTDAAQALSLVLQYCPDMPFWPQLPKRSAREGMVAQFMEGFPCVEVNAQGAFFNGAQRDAHLERFYERIIADDVAFFALTEESAAGFFEFRRYLQQSGKRRFAKAHITGPFTVAASLKDESGKMLLHDPVFRQAIISHLVMKARWQVQQLAPYADTLIVFVDEPFLAGFGSAYTALSREEAVQGLSELTSAIRTDKVRIGVHCCGNTDWSILTDVQTIDIINFDAFEYLDKFVLYAEDIGKFLARKGVICWGVVPTHAGKGSETTEELVARIDSGIEVLARKGVGRKELEDRLLVSPACGLGTLEVSRAREVLELLSAVSGRLRRIK